MDLTHIIQSVLAPGIMISSASLLLLGFQNKFSNLASRFRTLNHEKRSLLEKPGDSGKTAPRLESLEQQIRDLGRRAAYVEKAILLAYSSIICFTGTSILIFFHIYAALKISALAILSFLLGMVLIMSAAVFMILETRLFYRVILLEKKSC